MQARMRPGHGSRPIHTVHRQLRQTTRKLALGCHSSANGNGSGMASCPTSAEVRHTVNRSSSVLPADIVHNAVCKITCVFSIQLVTQNDFKGAHGSVLSPLGQAAARCSQKSQTHWQFNDSRNTAACWLESCHNRIKLITSHQSHSVQTARTVADLSTEGSLCTISAAGYPIGAPVSYRLDKDGNPVMAIVTGSPEAADLKRSSRVSLLVQPISQPARGVAAVALQGNTAAADTQDDAPDGTQLIKLTVDSCVYYGGLDHVSVACRDLAVAMNVWYQHRLPAQQQPGSLRRLLRL